MRYLPALLLLAGCASAPQLPTDVVELQKQLEQCHKDVKECDQDLGECVIAVEELITDED